MKCNEEDSGKNSQDVNSVRIDQSPTAGKKGVTITAPVEEENLINVGERRIVVNGTMDQRGQEVTNGKNIRERWLRERRQLDDFGDLVSGVINQGLQRIGLWATVHHVGIRAHRACCRTVHVSGIPAAQTAERCNSQAGKMIAWPMTPTALVRCPALDRGSSDAVG